MPDVQPKLLFDQSPFAVSTLESHYVGSNVPIVNCQGAKSSVATASVLSAMKGMDAVVVAVVVARLRKSANEIDRKRSNSLSLLVILLKFHLQLHCEVCA